MQGLCKPYTKLIHIWLSSKSFPARKLAPSGPAFFQSGESFRDGRRVFIIKTSIRGPPFIFMMGSSISEIPEEFAGRAKGVYNSGGVYGSEVGVQFRSLQRGEREVEKAQKRCWGAERGVFRVSRDMFSFIPRCIFHCVFHVIREVRLLLIRYVFVSIRKIFSF